MQCASITLADSPWQNLKIKAKYGLMRARGFFYPDIYLLPVWLGARVVLVPMGQRIDGSKYKFIFAELHAGDGQLEYLQGLVKANPGKVVVIPGPPEIFESYASLQGKGLAIRILRQAGQVWAYSEEVAKFANDYAQAKVARVIPWPFDYAGTRRIGCKARKAPGEVIRILLGVPLRFVGIAANQPHFLEECLAETLNEMTWSDRKRFQFYGMVYTKEDERAWKDSGFGKKVDIFLEPRKLYPSFLRFVAQCDAVINLPLFNVLGRISFIAAALNRPGIFTNNVSLNRRLYPASLVGSPTDETLRSLVRHLLQNLLGSQSLERFMPDLEATREIGDFAGNAAKVRQMICGD